MALGVGSSGQAATLSFVDGVEVVAGADHTVRATDGFQWRNNFQPRYADPKIGCASGAALLVDPSAGRYGAADCSNGHEISRVDGRRFDLLSADIAAFDMRQSTGSDPAPDRSFGYTEAYVDWTFDSAYQTDDRFWIEGLRDGAEVGRLYFGTRSDPLDASALTDLTGFRLGWDTAGTPFTDDISLIGYESNRQYCYTACEWMEMSGFSYALRDDGPGLLAAGPQLSAFAATPQLSSFAAAPQFISFAAASTSLIAVPVPGTLPLMLGAMGLGLCFGSRRRA